MHHLGLLGHTGYGAYKFEKNKATGLVEMEVKSHCLEDAWRGCVVGAGGVLVPWVPFKQNVPFPPLRTTPAFVPKPIGNSFEQCEKVENEHRNMLLTATELLMHDEPEVENFIFDNKYIN